MVAWNRVGRVLSVKATLALTVTCGLALCWLIPISKADAQAPPKTSTSTSDFAHVVDFEQGATRFQPGDKIDITEVRGTSEKFAGGNIYLVKGTYKLASHDRATLAAYITATDPKYASSPSLKVQHLTVDRGEGTFTLFLPMYHSGLPHVSFYPANGGDGFGGNYFGTGDSVLKKWWDEKK